jgi:preprotein translocase subunit SecA
MKTLENILDFIEHRMLDKAVFSRIYGNQTYQEVSERCSTLLNQVIRSLGIQEEWSMDEEKIIDKINSLISHLQSFVPHELKDHREVVLDPPFEKLREITKFIQNKKFIEDLVCQIASKKKSEIKEVLRKSKKFQDFKRVDELAGKIYQNAQEGIRKLLFEELYQVDFHIESDKYSKVLKAIDRKWSIDDENILDQLNEVLLSQAQEKHPEYEEKSLDQLLHEYAEWNNMDDSVIRQVKTHILNIRLNIEDLKNGKSLADDADLRYPIALIADICVKFERRFGDMMRNTQLLAILSMLDPANAKGSLSEVKTGEGKSYIIAALAIIKNRQGHEVDIITSSTTLARRDAAKFKAFYQEEFGIASADNCESDRGMMANPCYQPRSIVYGTTASFEGDSLRSEFFQAPTFNGRKRGIALLDEADSALLDKSSWLCQISDSVAGMSTVRPFLYYIWACVMKGVHEVKDKKFESKEAYDAFLETLKKEITENAEAFFSGGDKSFVIPSHLKPFTEFRISHWIDSALRAIFYTHNREYNACSVTKKITPVDYANTGEWEKDVQWEDGLHQFLHMKHVWAWKQKL